MRAFEIFKIQKYKYEKSKYKISTMLNNTIYANEFASSFLLIDYGPLTLSTSARIYS